MERVAAEVDAAVAAARTLRRTDARDTRPPQPAARGRGLATEIVRTLLAHAFAHPAVDEVIAHTSDENVASTRVLLRCGFSRVGPGPEPGSVEYRAKRAPIE